MSDDKSAKSPDDHSPSSSSSSSQPRQPDDLFSSVRRFADEHISAALHSVFGIPSILQTPQSSNWITNESERARFDNMNRRDGAAGSSSEESRHNGKDDEGGSGGNNNNNNGNGGSGISGFGGNSGSSGQQGPAPPSDTPSSSDRNSNDETNSFRLPSSLMPPPVLLPEIIFALGVQSADLLDRGFSGHVKEMEELIQEESNRRKASDSEARKDFGPLGVEFQRLIDMETAIKNMRSQKNENNRIPTSEMIVVRGTQTNDEEPQFSVTRRSGQHTGKPSILEELFGEDMYGSRRTRPLFTSLFDEFLPDGNYNKRPEQPPAAVRGRKLPSEATMTQQSSAPVDSFGHFFKLVMGPWIQKINENSDPAYFDVRARVIDRINNEMWNDVREDSPSLEEFNRMLHEERAKMARERIQRLAERRHELERLMNERSANDPQPAWTQEPGMRRDTTAEVAPKEPRQREPETELDLHNFLASLGPKNTTSEEKFVVSQSFSTTSTTGADGITRVKKVKERRYSDGTVEREEHCEENARAHPQAILDPFARLKRDREARDRNIQQAFERQKALKEEKLEISTGSNTQLEINREDGGKNGGWGSWLWASNDKKD
ncbi:hypothetical protein H072_7262 [Dactylellina haptotyla CBS 200.50]|uniref:Uncharacterized protein n=1 Tax=Dactylellina haptotyla (strain CBS 200.50) TaxID=1284197 RepID=S8BUI6_DACHA|nr:hypothetical protein H072_7262 [Dactylellina haptotyla CBS 200.50]